jgi:hypothetical protein
VPKISQRLEGMLLFMVQWDDRWLGGFELADPFPADMCGSRLRSLKRRTVVITERYATFSRLISGG